MLFEWVFALVAGGFFLAAIWTLLNALESRKWPTVGGVVVGSRIEEIADSDESSGYRREALIGYRYTVDGEEIIGTTTRFGTNAVSPKRTLLKYPWGAHVVVYYDPRNPRRAVLEPGLNASVFFALLVTAFILGGGLYQLMR